MRERMRQCWLLAPLCVMPLPVLAQAGAADSVAARPSGIVRPAIPNPGVPRDTLRSPQREYLLHLQVDALLRRPLPSLLLQGPATRLPAVFVQCPMPVDVTASDAVPMPVAKPESLATVPMPTVGPGCVNPLRRPPS